MQFVFATHNEHKVQEVAKIMSGLEMTLASLKSIGFQQEIIEDGATLEENAWIKADYIHQRLGGNVIAEDTGLEVSSLDGAPGVYSARYAGPQRSHEDNMDRLLAELKDTEDRTAQFRTILAVWLNEQKYTFEGKVKGRIDHNRSGDGGFGYDLLFIPDGYKYSFGVLSETIKNKISHRARAFDSFKKFLEEGLL